MQADRPIAHDGVVERLWNAAREKRLPHALSFEGEAGIGKFAAARWFAKGLLCAAGPGIPCERCGPCKRVASGDLRGNHPDLHLLDPHDPALADDFERSPFWRVHRIAYRPDTPGIVEPEYCVERFIDLLPAEGGFRPVLLREAHRMNEAAQNALLKTLEEPRPGTLLVLETHKGSRLLATIRSRCVRVRFRALTAEECERVLQERGIEGAEARTLARASSGSPGRALTWHAQGMLQVRALLAACWRGEKDPLAAAREIERLEGEFGEGNETARARERARAVLDLALALLNDRLRLLSGAAADGLAHGDVVGAPTERRGEVDDLAARVDAVWTARADVDRNLAPEGVLASALLVLGRGVPILSRSREP